MPESIGDSIYEKMHISMIEEPYTSTDINCYDTSVDEGEDKLQPAAVTFALKP